jgi:predicted ester cyclase
MSAQWRSVEDYEAMRRDPGPLPFLQEALTIARFEPGMYEIARQFSPAGKSGPAAMTKAELSDLYRAYLACLNAQDWARLGDFVHGEVRHNGEGIGLSGYREMLERDYREIPDLSFQIQLLIAEPPRLASRLVFDCRPKGIFLGLDVRGKRVSFAENVFYEFTNRKIAEVWSVIDKAAIEAQIQRED